MPHPAVRLLIRGGWTGRSRPLARGHRAPCRDRSQPPWTRAATASDRGNRLEVAGALRARYTFTVEIGRVDHGPRGRDHWAGTGTSPTWKGRRRPSSRCGCRRSPAPNIHTDRNIVLNRVGRPTVGQRPALHDLPLRSTWCRNRSWSYSIRRRRPPGTRYSPPPDTHILSLLSAWQVGEPGPWKRAAESARERIARVSVIEILGRIGGDVRSAGIAPVVVFGGDTRPGHCIRHRGRGWSSEPR